MPFSLFKNNMYWIPLPAYTWRALAQRLVRLRGLSHSCIQSSVLATTPCRGDGTIITNKTSYPSDLIPLITHRNSSKSIVQQQQQSPNKIKHYKSSFMLNRHKPCSYTHIDYHTFSAFYPLCLLSLGPVRDGGGSGGAFINYTWYYCRLAVLTSDRRRKEPYTEGRGEAEQSKDGN